MLSSWRAIALCAAALMMPVRLHAQAYPTIVGPDNILLYYNGPYRGQTMMSFPYICRYRKVDLVYLRNEILAKYGRPFDTRAIRDYFGRTSWYIENPAYSDSLLTSIDTENINRVSAAETTTVEETQLLNRLKTGAILRGANVPLLYSGTTQILGNVALSYTTDKCIKLVMTGAADQDNILSMFSVPVENPQNGYWFLYKGRLYLAIQYSEMPWSNTVFVAEMALDGKASRITGITILSD